MYNLRVKYHPYVVKCTPEHPFYVRKKGKKWNNNTRRYDYYFNNPEWINAKNLVKEQFYGMKINTNSIIPYFDNSKVINQHKTIIQEKAVNKKTKAIMPVHIYGHPANLQNIKKICKKQERKEIYLTCDTIYL